MSRIGYRMTANGMMRWTVSTIAATAALAWLLSGAPVANGAENTDGKKLGSGVSDSGLGEQDIVAFIDAQIRKGWTEAGYAPAPKATDAEWCRRVFLDVIGRVPTVIELNKFLGEGAQKKQKLLDRLLDSEEYQQEYANYWATWWSNLLVGRPPARRVNGELVNRDGMHKFLRDSYLRGKPYDRMVYELVSAEGNTSPNEKDFNGASNFIASMLKRDDPMSTQATAKTAKLFLGLQVQCTQCHNHPFNDWKQDQFWSMNAFFRQTKAEATTRMGRDIEGAELRSVDFRGEGNTQQEAEIYYELRNGTMAVAYPKFVDGTKIDPDGSVSKVNRRAELGKLIVKSEYFGRAIANRMWGHFLGYGFTKPVDDMGPHNQSSHPELLERLGKEFSAQGHDLKKLVRWITMSEAYSLSSKITPRNKKDDPAMGEKPKFSRFYLRQMSPEQLYDSLHAITRVSAQDLEQIRGGKVDERQREKREWISQFTVNIANDEGEDLTTFNGTIPQALVMMNGPLTNDIISVDKPDALLPRLVNSGMKGTDLVDFLYLSTVSRKPTSADWAVISGVLGSRPNLSAYQDVWWALINSNEFIISH
ncbi:MAG: DUF1549 domain-containing protein [Planctomycetes bacterium]|nr:DUF1549 domain-containing protein [Planctomycetota bacterium]